MPFRRRGHWRRDPRTNQRVWVEAHDVSSRASGGARGDGEVLGGLADRVSRRDGVAVADEMSELGDAGEWWGAVGSGEGGLEFSGSGRRTQRRTYRVGDDLAVRVPAVASIRRAAASGDGRVRVPVEGFVDGQLRAGEMLMRRDENGRWVLEGASGAWGDDSVFASRGGEAVVALLESRRVTTALGDVRSSNEIAAGMVASRMEQRIREDAVFQLRRGDLPVCPAYEGWAYDPSDRTLFYRSPYGDGDAYVNVSPRVWAQMCAAQDRVAVVDVWELHCGDWNRPSAAANGHCPVCGQFLSRSGVCERCPGPATETDLAFANWFGDVEGPQQVENVTGISTGGALGNTSEELRSPTTRRISLVDGSWVRVPAVSSAQSYVRDGRTWVGRISACDPATGQISWLRVQYLRDETGQLQVVPMDGPVSHDSHVALLDAANAVANTRRPRSALQEWSQARIRAAEGLQGTPVTIRSALPEGDFRDWTSNPEEFQVLYNNARERMNASQNVVPFHLENATGGLAAPGQRGFGVELEYQGGDTTEIGRVLYEQGLTQVPAMVPWGWGEESTRYGSRSERVNWLRTRGFPDTMADVDRSKWMLISDSSVVSGGGGGELVSPILHDERAHWEQLQQACTTIRSHGGAAGPATGGHVHVGVGDWGRDINPVNRLNADMSSAADTYFRVGANPTRRVHRGTAYCDPHRGRSLHYRTFSDFRRTNHSGSYDAHHSAISFEEVNGTENAHVEMRWFDGSLDPGTIQGQINVSLGMVHAATIGREAAPVQEQVGDHYATNPTRRRLDDHEWEQNTASVRQVADRVGGCDIAREQIVALFAQSRWQQPNI